MTKGKDTVFKKYQETTTQKSDLKSQFISGEATRLVREDIYHISNRIRFCLAFLGRVHVLYIANFLLSSSGNKGV